MEYKDIHILCLDGYARQCLPYLRAFKELGCETTVLCDSKLDCGCVSRLPDHRIIGACSVKRLKESEECIINVVSSNKFDLVIPFTEYTATILAEYKEYLSKYAYIAINDKNVFDYAQDKNNIMKTCMENNLPCPYTIFNANNVEDILNSGIRFPIILKPRKGYGSKGFHKIQDENMLVECINKNEIDISKMVVQECLPIESLVVSDNLFIGQDGEIKSSFIYGSYRTFPIDGGSGTLNITLDRKDIQEICKKLIETLNLRGIVGVDLMVDSRDNTAKIIEVNLRALACSKIGFISGINQAKQLIDDIFMGGSEKIIEYKTDVRVRMSQIDILWFIKSPNRFKSKPSWFSQKNTKDQLFSLDDPLPWFAFLIKGLLNLRRELKARS